MILYGVTKPQSIFMFFVLFFSRWYPLKGWNSNGDIRKKLSEHLVLKPELINGNKAITKVVGILAHNKT